MRASVMLGCVMCFSAGLALSQVASAQAETELTASAGLIIEVGRQELRLIPERPYIWCSAIGDPIPVVFDTTEWENATIGEFGLLAPSVAPNWDALRNREQLSANYKAMTGLKLGLKRKTPAVFSLSSLLKKSHAKEIRKRCEEPSEETIFIKFTVSVDDGMGSGMHVDPGIGVKRGG